EAPGTNRIDVFLDDGAEPIASYSPPLRFELDTTRLPDGPHTLRVEAYDSFGTKGVKVVRFTVRNGPGIVVSGLRQDDVLEGTVPVLVNSYGGAVESKWEPSRAETPSPVPTWAWVLVIMLVAYGLYYGVQHWNPPPDVAAVSGQTAAAAPAPTAGPAAGARAPAAGPARRRRAGADPPGAGTPPGGGAAAPAGDPPAVAGSARELGASVSGTNCASCHPADGRGLPGVFPPIAGDPVV